MGISERAQVRSSNLRQLRVHIEGLSDTQGHRRARPLGAVRGPSMTVPVTTPEAVRIGPQELHRCATFVHCVVLREEAESFRLRTTASREMSEPERRSARPVARPQRLEYPGHAAPAPRERAPRAAAGDERPPKLKTAEKKIKRASANKRPESLGRPSEAH